MKFIQFSILTIVSLSFLVCSSLPKKENPTYNGCSLKFKVIELEYTKDRKHHLVFEDNRIKVGGVIYDDLSSVFDDWIRAKKNGKYGFIDLKDKVVMDFEFSLVGDFNEGYAVFRAGEDRKDPRGFVDKKGDLLGNQYYDMTYLFQNGLAGVEINKKYGFIDRNGKVVIPIKYDFITGIIDGWGIFKREEHQGLLNSKGQEKKFIHDKYELRGYYYEGTIVYKYLKKEGIMDSNFKEITPPNFDYIGNFHEGLVRFKIGNKWGFLDENGKIVIEPKFDSEYDFSEGYASVSIGEKYGIINPKGEYLIEPKFSYISSFHEGLAVVEEDGKKGFINKNAEWVVPPVFDKLNSYKDGVFTFAIEEKWGFVNLRNCKN